MGWDVPGKIVPLFTRRDNWGRAAWRRSFGIHAYTGSNGGGKSLCMIHDTIPSLEAGRPVLSTVRLLDYERPRPCPGGAACDDPATHRVERVRTRLVPADPDDPDAPLVRLVEPTGIYDVHDAAHPLYVRLHDYRQLLDWRNGDIVLDEVTGVASSRESHGMPAAVANLLVQLRRRDVLLRWSTPRFARADKIIREVTTAVTDCAGTLAVYRSDEAGSRMWRDRRLFHWWTYDDVAEFDEWSQGKADDAEPVVKQRFWRPGSVTETAYDTLDPVSSLGAANEYGLCLDCGGKRVQHRCECGSGGGRHAHGKGTAVRRARAQDRETAEGGAERAQRGSASPDAPTRLLPVVTVGPDWDGPR